MVNVSQSDSLVTMASITKPILISGAGVVGLVLANGLKKVCP